MNLYISHHLCILRFITELSLLAKKWSECSPLRRRKEYSVYTVPSMAPLPKDKNNSDRGAPSHLRLKRSGVLCSRASIT